MATNYHYPLNNQLAMLQLQMAALSRQQAPGARTKEVPGAATNMKDINKEMYDAYRKRINKALRTTMWPTMLLSMGVEWGPQLTAKAKEMGIGGAAPIIEKLMGPLGAASYLVPSVLSNLLRTKKLSYEKYVQPQLGAVGTAARTMDLYNMTRHMMRTIPYASALLMGNKQLAKAIPRPENFMTGAATGAYELAKKGAKAAAGAVDTATGGVISKGIKSAAATPVGQGVASTLKKVFGGIDTGILSTLGSPMGISLALAGVQMGLSIMKSIKMARLFPTKRSVAKLSSKYSLTKQSAQIVAQIDALAQTGKVRLEQLIYQLLKLLAFNTEMIERQIAEFRAEAVSEMDFVRQEKEKGEDRFSEAYGREIEGEDDRSVISKVYDKIEGGIQTIMNKYNPFHQMSNFIVGLLHGKIVTPKGEMARIAKTYGFDNEKEMLREKAIEFGISTSQVRLLTTDSRSILRLAPTYEAKMLAILAAQYDIQRMIAAEALTIRKGMGFSESLLYTGVPKEGLIQDLIGALKKLDPTNLPVVNAAWNLLKLPFKMVRGAARRAQRAGDWMSRAYGFVREKMLGEEYIKLESPEELLKKAGLYKKPEERAFEFVGRGLPQSIETIRLTLLQQLEVQENIFNVLQRQLEISGYMYDYQTKQIEPVVWDPIEARYITMEEADKLKQSRKLQLEVTGEEAFRKGPLGKFLQFLDVATKGFKKADDLDRALERMFGAEEFLGRFEAGPQIEELNTMGRWKRFWKVGGLLGRPETYSTEKIAKTLIEKELAGIYTTHVKMPFSKEEAEFRRSLETLPESMILKGLGTVGETILPGIGGGLFGLLLNALKRKAYVKREKEISTRTDIERQIEQLLENGLFEQTYSERLEEMTGRSVIGAKAGVGLGVGARLTGIPKVDIQTDLLRNILTVLVKDAIKVDVVKIGERELSQIGTTGPFLPVGIRQEALTKIESISKYLDVNVTNWEELKKQIPDLDILLAGGKKFPIDVFGADEALRVHMVGEGGQLLVSRTPFVDINIASIGGKDISEGLIPVTVGEWKALVKDRRVMGGSVGRGPVIVGEKGPEVYIPHAAEGKDVGTGTILPNNITVLLKGVVEVLQRMLGIQREELKVVSEEVKLQKSQFEIAKESRDRTLQQELAEVKAEKEKQEQKSIWIKMLDVLQKIWKKPDDKKQKKEEQKSFLDSLFDWILDKLPYLIGAGLAAIGLKKLFDKFDNIVKFLKEIKEYLNRQGLSDKDLLYQGAKTAGIVGTGLWAWARKAPLEAAKDTGKAAKAGIVTKGIKFLKSKGGAFKTIGRAVQKIRIFFTKLSSAFEAISSVLKPVLKVVKGISKVAGRFLLPLNMILTAWDFISDAIEGYKTEGIWGAIKGAIIGKMKDDLSTTASDIGKYAGLGALIGMPFAPPIGPIVGALIGGAIGAVISAVKSIFIKKDEKGWAGAIFDTLFSPEGGLNAALKGAGLWAGIGAAAGSLVFPGLGTIGGAILGAAIGGIINFFGTDKIKGAAEYMANLPFNQPIITFFEDMGGGKWGLELAKWGSFIPIVGPIAGFVVGSVIDLGLGVFSALTGFGKWIAQVLPSSDNVASWFGDKGTKAYEWALTANNVVPLLGGFAGGFVGSLVDGLISIFEDVGKLWNWIKEKFGGWTKAIKSLFGVKEGDENAPRDILLEKSLGYKVSEEQKKGQAKTAAPAAPATGGVPPTAKPKTREEEIAELAESYILSGVVTDPEEARRMAEQEVDRRGKQRVVKMGQQSQWVNVPKATQAGAAGTKPPTGTQPSASATQAGEAGTKPPTGEVRSTVQIGEPAKVAAPLEGQIPKATQAGEAGTKPPTGEVRSTVQIGEPAKVAAPLEGQIPKAAQAGVPIDKEKMDKELSQTIPPPSTNVGEALKEASQKTGEPLDTLTRIAYVESKLNPLAQAKGSSAKGLFQFITDTWKEMTSKFGSKYGVSPETSPFDARANALMGGEFLKRNEQAIASTAPNHPPSAADLYIAHFLGAGGANEFFKQLRKDPNQVAADVFPKAAASNPNIFYVDGNKNQPRTLAQVYELMGKKMKVDTTSVLASITPKYEGVKEEVAQPTAASKAAEYEPTEKEIEDYIFEASKSERRLTKEEARQELIAAKKAEKDREAKVKGKETKGKEEKRTSILDFISSPFKMLEDAFDKALAEGFEKENVESTVNDVWSGLDEFQKEYEERKKAEASTIESIGEATAKFGEIQANYVDDLWSGQEEFNKMLEERKKAEEALPDLWSGQEEFNKKLEERKAGEALPDLWSGQEEFLKKLEERKAGEALPDLWSGQEEFNKKLEERKAGEALPDLWSGQEEFNKMLEERKKAEEALPDLWSGQEEFLKKYQDQQAIEESKAIQSAYEKMKAEELDKQAIEESKAIQAMAGGTVPKYEPTRDEIEERMFEARKAGILLSHEDARKELLAEKGVEEKESGGLLDLLTSPFKKNKETVEGKVIESTEADLWSGQEEFNKKLEERKAGEALPDLWSGQEEFNKMLEERKKAGEALPDLWSGQEEFNKKLEERKAGEALPDLWSGQEEFNKMLEERKKAGEALPDLWSGQEEFNKKYQDQQAIEESKAIQSAYEKMKAEELDKQAIEESKAIQAMAGGAPELSAAEKSRLEIMKKRAAGLGEGRTTTVVGEIPKAAELLTGPAAKLEEVKKETTQERIEEKAKELEEKAKKVSEETAQKEEAVTGQATTTEPVGDVAAAGSTSITPVAVDPWLDNLIDKLFNSIALTFNDDFKKYPYESNVSHTMNI